MKNQCTSIGSPSGKSPHAWRFVLILVLVTLAACRDDPESSAAKSENSALQAMMLRHRSEAIKEVTLFTEMGYHFACIPSNGDKIWLMLDARYTPYYKQEPWDRNFWLSEADFEKIEQSNVATPVVIQCLASHISDKAQ
jgi:hypothetical protein